ncbi:MAG: hypothetical protein WCA44_18240 [Acidobacteriaceae bacterium]
MKAEVFVELARAVVAGAVAGAMRSGAGAQGSFAVHAFALGEGRESAAAIGFEVKREGPFAVAVVEEDFSGSALAFEVLEVLGSEPAGVGHVGGGFGCGAAEALAFLLVAELVEAPVTVEASLFAGVFDGAEEMEVGAREDFGDGLGGGFLFFGGLEAGGAGHGVGDNLAAVEELAGAMDIDGVGEDSLHDLGGEDLDGFEVFEEGEGDVGAALQDGVAVFGVTDAEVLAAEGGGAAHASGEGEGTAADGGGTEDGGAGDGLRSGGHGGSFQWSCQRPAASCQRPASWRVSDRRSAFGVQPTLSFGQGWGTQAGFTTESTEKCFREKEKAARGAAFFLSRLYKFRITNWRN